MSSRGWTPQFGESICNMLVHLASKGIRNENVTFTTYFLRGASLPAVGRQMAVKRALAENYTHLLMIDDDHQFPADMCDVLFARKVPVVAANLLKKNPEKLDGTATTIRDEAHDPRGRTDIEEASLVGTGIILINVNAVRHIPQPLFDNPYISEEIGHLGEDYYFCEKAKEYGVKIFIDNLISNTATHVGDYGFHWGSNFPLDKHSHIGDSFLTYKNNCSNISENCSGDAPFNKEYEPA